ncbi:hypothetical protein SULI_11180 [Saccharolobus solfataricus]|uniref:Uncharacterized protein n=3 Tax=Saccharolobus solfataricus TaxID=2287 RepID=A0A0E3KDA6_SACSO|nr:hypothetical protein SULB_2215 [Saccharolobus solfataricus]AKA77090.1 hypothetical protein SULC_2212 [Saccharolobus solfataricus]AKA79783.1 hypothetical protein SULA_2214 [Saccharolobus solfataricus]AZF68875.1 hypothetical protein SULG_11180 [Saccharolobus solfataricus]AZF71495.1 hypothetical protein SULH_11180 [Saccharolobus solfataricus]
MIVTNGVSVTETPWLKRGSMRYASAPDSSPKGGNSVMVNEFRSGSERPLVWSSALYRWQGGGMRQEALSVRAGQFTLA